MGKILIKRGLQAAVNNLVLSEGELAVALDTGNVYIGATAGVIHINPNTTNSAQFANVATQLESARSFSITGDGTSTPINFDGTANVAMNFILKNIAGLVAGTYTKLTVDAKGRVTAGTTLDISDIPVLPKSKISDMPTKLSEFTNDSGYQTSAQVQTAISNLVGSAPEALDTLKELALALGNDANFASTMTTALGNKEALIKNATAKTSLVDADTIPLSDSATSSTTKKITFANIKAVLKTYFDTLYNKYVHPTYTPKVSGLYKITVDNSGHISGATAVTKTDITALGIPAQDTVYTLPTATASVTGGVKVGSGLTITSGVLSVGDIDGGTF